MSWRTKPLPKDWRKRRRRILDRDPVCRVCRARPSTQVDHVQPSGSDEDWNLRGICNECHKAKTALEGVTAQGNGPLRKRQPEPHPGERGAGRHGVGGNPRNPSRRNPAR